MILYLDTSALVKLYVEEAHSDLVREAVNQASLMTSHAIAYAEARAAFRRRANDPKYAAALPQWRVDFEADWARIQVLEVTHDLIRRAGDLADAHNLRGYDSVHLAAAEAVWQALPGVDFRFAAFDTKLMAAAKALGMRGLE